MTQPLHSLPPEQRSQQYRDLANEAFRTARESATPERQAEFMRQALGWYSMAQDIEARSSHLEEVEKTLRPSEPKQNN